ncbi:hypothetical protein CCAX7_53800 [Capsulimonas corticalis]|uniref:Uncharacterized protein n=1 Tax=Capsulimonas corticalis TaxID=2219043 RepID=A0A402CNN9_9BACT|nr:SMI1/KNR4 family protein [Capsulimonas corticalis]BDI33329.1 hypothetical protein CCAX7_53800 [Capsulimonas corticalis]
MDIARLNVTDGSKPTLGYSGDPQLFNELSDLVGKPLPAAYIEFLHHHDGGAPEVDTFFPQGESDLDSSFGVSNFYSISKGTDESVFHALDAWKDILGEHLLPIAYDGGNNQIYLDLNDDIPSVWLWLHDEGEDEFEDEEADVQEEGDGEDDDEDGEYYYVVKIADSFEEFIDGLTIHPDCD